MAAEEFVELGRTFHELSNNSSESDALDLHSMYYTGSGITWDKLLGEYRVVILSEAGSGKTEEVRNVARQLRRQGRRAFFVRLEHVRTDFEDAFEESSFREFESWLNSEEEGWLLLDSVDEARLRSPLDFELAVKKVARRIAPALQRSHIVVTGRSNAWRAKTDLGLCTNLLPYLPKQEAVEDEGGVEEDAMFARESTDQKRAGHFTIVTLDDLNPVQIQMFAKAKGVGDTRAFIDAIERADALSFTSRPDDLIEVVEFWRAHGRIGSRLELMQNSIKLRLTERDQNRAELKPLSKDQAHRGARLIAGATTMVQTQIIRIPDGSEQLDGLLITKLLPDWDEQECSTLLGRPIFDQAIYGAVRFHHRSVREYLAAEWLHGLLAQEVSRRSIEACFFREHYGLEVLVPSTRPLLPWLIILDERIRNRALRLAPELIFEGGDPSQLPLPTRRRLLREICAQLARHRANQPNIDFAAVQRFASAELAGDIVELMKEYARNADVVWLLLRMIWQGQIASGLPIAKSVAVNRKTSKYPRIAAFRAVAALGSEVDKTEVRESFVKERAKLDRAWLAELVNSAAPNERTVPWLLEALRRATPPAQYHTEGLADAVITFFQNSSLDQVAVLVAGLAKLLARPPMVERRLCEISGRYRWLTRIAALGVQRLIEAGHGAALSSPALDVLYRYRMAEDRDDFELRKLKFNFPELVQARPELRDRLFWYEVAQARKLLDKKKHERLTEWWRVSAGGSLWNWGEGDFDHVVSFIRDRTLLDDKLVALSLAFRLYRRPGRSRRQREALRKAVAGNAELEAQLNRYLHPGPESEPMRAHKRHEYRWKRQQERRALREAKTLENWRAHLSENVEKLRNPGLPRANQITNAQYYLYQQLREDAGHDHWSSSNWRSLIGKYGSEVATAFRDGVMKYWRRNSPKLLSEGAEPNRIPLSTIFGLIGIGVEAEEVPNWPKNLPDADAELATRYATYELNGFPSWLPRLYAVFPDAVNRVLLNEMRWELSQITAEQQSHYVLSDVSWHGEWMWEKWAPILVKELDARDPANLNTLTQLLTIIQGSALPDEQLRDLAANKCRTISGTEQLAQWYAVWVGVAPEHAIPSLKDRIALIADGQTRLGFAMQFVTHLLGGRRGGASAVRSAYRTVTHLKSLYLLMHEHIRRREDIDHAGKGVFSPGLRDDAQDARERLLGLLQEIPGKEAFLALMEISAAHPERTARPWFKRHAKAKAEQDVETGPWQIKQFVEFNDQLERTPANHCQLFELACMRLVDLKSDLETGDASVASILKKATRESHVRNYIGGWLRDRARTRYTIPQEEEFADATRPDLRFHGTTFDGPVPMELKLADNWTGPHLFERLENQLCRDYLRDSRSNRGIFGLVYRGKAKRWALPNSSSRVNFDGLVRALEEHWRRISTRLPNVEEVRVIGIDLTKRGSKPLPA